MVRQRVVGLVVISLLATCVLVLASCSGGPEGDSSGQGGKEEFKIGVANFTQSAPYFIAMDRAVEEAASTYENVEVTSTDANGDAAKLTSDVEDLVSQGVDGIIVSAGPLASAPGAMAAASNADIPVVLVDRKLEGGEYASWIGPDNKELGKQSGKYIVDRLGGKGNVIGLRGGPADNTIGLARTNGLKSALEQSNVEFTTAPGFGEWSVDGGFALMEDVLSKNQDIDTVFCENDSMCLGARRAVEDSGRSDEMFLVGVDGQKQALEQIMADGSNYAATSLNDPDEIGKIGFNRLMNILAGANPEKNTVLPAPLITDRNVGGYYDKDSIF